MPLEFIGEAEHSGLPGYMYNFPENFLEQPDVNPDNECYCRNKDKCSKKGLLDMSPCYYSESNFYPSHRISTLQTKIRKIDQRIMFEKL